jgi:glycosyltransferase involved in cell wall biosynthesis
MMNQPSPLSIVICAFNGLEYTKLLVESIRRHSRFSHEVVIYSDGSSDGTLEWLRDQPDIRWQHDRTNRGICTAMNRAARLATRPNLFFPNTDHVLAPGWDEAMIKRLAPRTVVSCQCIEPGIVPVAPIFHAHDCGARWDEFDEAKFLAAAAELRREQAVPGVNYPFALSRTLWDEAGGLDERFNPGPANDPDLFYRLTLLGAEMVRAEDCLAYHFSGKSSRLAGEASVEHRAWHEVTERNEARFAEKWGERYRYANGGLPDPGPEARRRWNDQLKPLSPRVEVRSRLKVAIDAGSVDDRAQGIGVYTLNLIRALADRRDELELHLLSHSPGILRRHVGEIEGIAIHDAGTRPKELGAAVYHGPAFALPEGIGVPGVVTIHDLIFMLFPQWYPDDFVRHMKGTVAQSLDRAARVIAVSDQTKSDLIKQFGVDPARVARIHEAAPPDASLPGDPRRIEEIRSKFAEGRRFILAVGMQQRRKNAAGLVKAFAKLKADLHLVLVGAEESEDPKLRDGIKRLRLTKKVTLTPHLSRPDLLALYRAAEMLVYPSFYEGFGLPPLEAMACGTPVIASDRPSMPEILDDAALLVSQGDPKEMARAMTSVLEDPALRKSLIERGKFRAARYSWSKAADETLQVYREAAEPRPIEIRQANQPRVVKPRFKRSSKPRIAVDARLLGQERLGTGRYTTEILRGLVGRANDAELVFIGPEAVDPAMFPSTDTIMQLVPAAADTLLNPAWEQYSLPSHLLGCDLYFAPTGIAPVTAQCPTVPVIHDLGFEDHPEYYDEPLRSHLSRWVRNSCLAADRIIAVSGFTRDRIVRTYGIPAAKIEVIHHGKPKSFGESNPDREAPYVLCVSSFEPNKNLPMLVEAFRTLGRTWAGRLVLAGRSGRDLVNVRALVESHGLQDRVKLAVDPADGELDRLYQRATLFAFPSLYEGFGLPLLEAMAAGLPVVVGSFPACREVAGAAGLAVVEDTPDAWASALIRTLGDATELKEMGRKSLARAEAFSWESSAEKTWDTLMSCLEAG